MKRKVFGVFLAAALSVGMLYGCGNPSGGGSQEPSTSAGEEMSSNQEAEKPAEAVQAPGNVADDQEKVDFSTVPEGFRVVTVGSGAPGVNPARGNASTLVQYKDKYFLVDCGYGTCLRLTELGLPIQNITNVLITHEHEDHNADFDHFMLAGWYNAQSGRTTLNLVGPQVQTLYDDIYDMNKDDIDGRLEVGAKQGTGVSTDGISTNVNIYDVTDADYSMELDGVQITMHKVIHGNMQAYSYRFTADGKSVVVTGDVAYTDDLAAFYKDTDLLVIDALTMTGYFSQFTEEMIEKSMGNTHMTQTQMGKLLNDSGAKGVILTHIGGEFIDYDATVEYFRSTGYEGEVYGAYDGMAVEL